MASVSVCPRPSSTSRKDSGESGSSPCVQQQRTAAVRLHRGEVVARRTVVLQQEAHPAAAQQADAVEHDHRGRGIQRSIRQRLQPALVADQLPQQRQSHVDAEVVATVAACRCAKAPCHASRAAAAGRARAGCTVASRSRRRRGAARNPAWPGPVARTAAASRRGDRVPTACSGWLKRRVHTSRVPWRSMVNVSACDGPGAGRPSRRRNQRAGRWPAPVTSAMPFARSCGA